MYSIYDDRDVLEEEGNWDHIYPLSLGGVNGFTAWCSEKTNSRMGTQVDGPLVKDPILMFPLRNSGVKGQSGHANITRWRRGSMGEGRPVQVTFGVDKISVWDAKQGRLLEDHEIAGQQFTADLKIGKHDALRFVAKAALGGGYFLYNESFRSGVDCDELRELVFLDLNRAKDEKIFDDSNIRFIDRFHPDSRTKDGLLYRSLCESLARSIFIAVPHHESISFHVGIVGQYLGSIIIPADTKELPNDGDHDVGHVVMMAPGSIQRISLRQLAQDYYEALNRGEVESSVSKSDQAVGSGK